jgi:hypothetical protein
MDEATASEERSERSDRFKGSISCPYHAWTQIRQIVIEEAPICFVHFETINYLMRNDVAGSTVNPTLETRFVNVGFTEAQ